MAKEAHHRRSNKRSVHGGILASLTQRRNEFYSLNLQKTGWRMFVMDICYNLKQSTNCSYVKLAMLFSLVFYFRAWNLGHRIREQNIFLNLFDSITGLIEQVKMNNDRPGLTAYHAIISP